MKNRISNEIVRQWTAAAGLFVLICLGVAARAQEGNSLVINEFMAENKNSITDKDGDSSDWIEIYNRSASTVSLTNWYLTDVALQPQQWAFPNTNLAAGKYLIVYASSKDRAVAGQELHTNFKLNSSGEYLGLFNGTNVVSEYAPEFPAQQEDISYGLGPGDALMFFSPSTPGATNTGGAVGIADNPVFIPSSCLFSSSILANATSATAGASIYYTTNCDPPTALSTLYTGPIPLGTSMVFRARASKTNYVPSGTNAYTYIFLESVLRQPSSPSGFPMTWNSTAADYGMDQVIVNDAAYAPLMTNALRALPSVSLVTAKSNLFDNATGIYANPGGEGIAWERPVTLEWLNTNNTSLFKVDCGLRIQGGAFRSMGLTRKKSFRVLFKSIYGPSKLRYDLFTGQSAVDAVDEFDTIDFRAGANDAWNNWGGARTQYMADEFTRRSHIAMGDPSPHGGFAHLYLDGLYWGVYNFLEKPAESFASYYYGGDKTNWDVVVNGTAIEGSVTAWNALVTLCNAGVADNTSYQKIQGNNPDRTRNPAYPDYLDVDNYIDYLMVRHWVGDVDWPGNNWHALRNRDNAASTGFKFAVWDAEAGLDIWGTLGTDRTAEYGGVAQPYGKLIDNPEFKLLFADHVYRHFFNSGALTTNQVIPRYRDVAAGLDPALVCESARWGDQSGTRYTLANWRTETNYVLTTYLPQRPATVLQQYKNRGLYPSIDPPVFSQRGGVFTNGFMVTLTSSGNSIYYTLDGTDPRQYGSGNPVGTLYSGGITLPYTAKVKARARTAGGVWSALNEALFTLSGPAPQLRITEVMYNPRQPVGSETNGMRTADDFEFVEVRNIGAETAGLAGIKLTAGITFDFTDSLVTSLGPGEYAVVVKTVAAFTNRYASRSGIRIAGEYQHAYDFPQGSLSDGGEAITLKDATNATLSAFTYSDGRGWPLAADGAGHSLVPLVLDEQTGGALDYGGHWRASARVDGSPGATDPEPVRDVVINEVMAYTRYTNGAAWQTSNDWLELFNASGGSLAFTANWYLSDDPDNLKKWAIPATNTIPAAGWLSFFEVGGFHPATNSGFGVNEDGEQVYVSYLPGTTNDRVADCVSFKGQEAGRTWGRYGDGGAWWYTALPTPGAANLLATQAVVISEIMYHPATNALYPEDNGDNEYIELYNPGPVAIALTNSAGAYRLDGGISYSFPANTTIPAGGYLLVVSFDPSTNSPALTGFLDSYWLTNGQARMAGPYSGRLSDRSDRVALERPQLSETPGAPAAWVIVDEVIYADQGPWPDSCDGTGNSLRRLWAWQSGNDPANWMGSLPTPGLLPVKITLVKPDSGSILFAPATAKFTAVIDYAQVSESVEWVQFWEGTQLLYVATAPPYEYTWEVSATGAYQFWARMKDASGTNDTQQYAVGVLALENAGASNVTDLAADLYGRLSGGGQADVSICWGTSDAGTNRWGWETVAPVGSVSAGLFSVPAGNIMTPVIYYRAYARAGGNEGWAPSTASLAMRSYTTWSQHLAITVGAYTNSETLYNFPLLVTLGTNISGFTYGAFGTNWYSLRFTDEQGRRLPYEVQSWNTNGSSYLWVGVAALTNRAVLHAWWGNAAATSAPAYTQDGSVWTPGYDGVWHLEAGLAESSGLSQSAADYGSTGVTGLVLQGRRFDGTNAYVDPRVGPAWYESNRDHLTVSFWVKPDSRTAGQSDRATAFGSETLNYDPGGSPSNRSLYVRMNTSVNSEKWYMGVHDADKALSAARYSTTQWQLITLVLSNGTAYGSMNDGARVAITNYSDMVLGAAPMLGKRNGATNMFKGSIDEFRLARVARSAAWTQAECVTITNALQYGTVGPASVNPDANGNGLPDAWEQACFGTNVVSAEGDWDGDGMSNTNEYTAGTDPTNPASYFAVDVTNAGGQQLVQFLARSAQGVGYEGYQRFYDLLSASGLVSSVWWIIPGYSNLPGNDAVNTYTNAPEPGANTLFFQGRTRLQ